jgi:hypothetical protein
MDMRVPIGRGGILEEATIRMLLQKARHIDPDYARIANELVSEAGDILPRCQLEAFIRAELTNEQVKAELRRQNAFVKRLGELLPTILSYFSPEAGVATAINVLDDCFYDFPIVATSPRKDRSLREAIQDLERIDGAIADIIQTLSRVELTIGSDFSNLFKAFLAERFPSEPRSQIEIGECFSTLKNIIEIALLRARTEDGYVFADGNQVKTHVVETAFLLSNYFSGPPLVTTPGSDFAVLCSLIYEVMSGAADESLAGAINKFARSQERHNEDRNQAQIQ